MNPDQRLVVADGLTEVEFDYVWADEENGAGIIHIYHDGWPKEDCEISKEDTKRLIAFLQSTL